MKEDLILEKNLIFTKSIDQKIQKYKGKMKENIGNSLTKFSRIFSKSLNLIRKKNPPLSEEKDYKKSTSIEKKKFKKE
jgi:hypothetical protein